jgi:hypothetical protein
MDRAFFVAYRSINLFFGLEALVFGVLFLVMAVPRSASLTALAEEGAPEAGQIFGAPAAIRS